MPTTDEHGKIVKRPSEEIREWLGDRRSHLEALLPEHLSVDRMIQMVMQSYAETPKLMECTKASVMIGVVQVSKLGLELGKGLDQAWLVPYRQRGVYQAQLIIGYKGYCDLAYRGGEVFSIRARPVYEGERFVYREGLVRVLEHESDPAKHDPEALLYTYAVASLRGVSPEMSPFRVVTRGEIDATKARSRARNGPWLTDFVPMACKTAVRRLGSAAEVPVSSEFRLAAAIDESVDSDYETPYEPEARDVAAAIIDIDISGAEPVRDYDPELGEVPPDQEPSDEDLGLG